MEETAKERADGLKNVMDEIPLVEAEANGKCRCCPSFLHPLTCCYRKSGLALGLARAWTNTYNAWFNRAVVLATILSGVLVMIASDFLRTLAEQPDATIVKLSLVDIVLYRVVPWLSSIFLTSIWIFTPLYTLHWIPFHAFSCLSFCGLCVADLATTAVVGVHGGDTWNRSMYMYYLEGLLITALRGLHVWVKGFLFGFMLLGSLLLYAIRDGVRVSLQMGAPTATILVFCVAVSISSHLKEAEEFYVRLRTRKQTRVLEEERSKTTSLLHLLLPKRLVSILVSREDADERMIGESYDVVGLLSCDIVGFTVLCGTVTPSRLLEMLNACFGRMDDICCDRGLTKVAILGDMHLSVSGCPQERQNHLVDMACGALAFCEYSRKNPHGLKFRIGVHCGSVIAGVIVGATDPNRTTKSLKWDVFGRSVQELLWCEETSECHEAHCSSAFRTSLLMRLKSEKLSSHQSVLMPPDAELVTEADCGLAFRFVKRQWEVFSNGVCSDPRSVVGQDEANTYWLREPKEATWQEEEVPEVTMTG